MKYASVPLSAIMKHPRKSLKPEDYMPDEEKRDRLLGQAKAMRQGADTLERKALADFEEQEKTAKEAGIEVHDG